MPRSCGVLTCLQRGRYKNAHRDFRREHIPWHTPGRSPVVSDAKGREAVFAQLSRYGGETEWTFKAILKDVFSSDSGLVIGLHHNTAQRDGKQLDTYCCIVFELNNGRIIEGREQFSDLYN